MGVTRAYEMTGTVDEQHFLHLDEMLPMVGPGRVKVIILVPEEDSREEEQWLRAAAANPALDFLNDPLEDVYTESDGKPFHVAR